MIEINLLPVEYRPKLPKFVAPQLPVKKTFILLASIFLLAQLGVSIFTVFQVTRLRLLKNQVEVLEKESKEIASKKKEISAYAKRFRVFADIAQRNFYWSSLLNELTRTMTKGVWLTGFGIKDGSSEKDGKQVPTKVLKLDGSVVGQGEETAFTGKYIRELKSNAMFTQLFSSIELSNLVQKKIREVDVYDFSIYCTMKPVKEKKKKEAKKEPKKAPKSEPKKGKDK